RRSSDLSFFPQIFKTFKTRSARDMSLVTLCQLSLGVFLWILYGINIKDKIIITANSVTLFSLLVLLFLYFSIKGKA
ncbi:MAG: SemiSWEET family transporter, partial [Candidatus Omnitrophica bacterium]|nr:SemiSWEET family transporter [Candidatus Omnitrophota bacterium]